MNDQIYYWAREAAPVPQRYPENSDTPPLVRELRSLLSEFNDPSRTVTECIRRLVEKARRPRYDWSQATHDAVKAGTVFLDKDGAQIDGMVHDIEPRPAPVKRQLWVRAWRNKVTGEVGVQKLASDDVGDYPLNRLQEPLSPPVLVAEWEEKP